ncbi:lipase family protein [Nocardia sp. NPDC050175]|uniref:lipase family protein n=1 Tax=Nocardia sp. NPDC050175 TaxID=3364317 RepID=UPI003797747A
MRARIVFPILAAIVVAACGTSTDTAEPKVQSPGTLISKRSLGNLDPQLSSAVSSATYIRYQSTSPAGKPIEVSGAVFLPNGDAPAGGWPLIAFAHATTGVANACAPTSLPAMLDSGPAVAQILAGHRAVVMTNYQGLDGPGNAPYIDSLSSGYDVLNAVRAARATGQPLAQDTVIVGGSQGGRAAESAAETTKSYAPELNIRGVVLLSPALELRFTDGIRAGTLNAPDQYLMLPYLMAAVRYHNPGYGDDRVLHGDLLAAAPRLEKQCTNDTTPADVAVGTAATPDAARFADDAAAQPFSDFESRNNLPKSATTLPTYILRGDADVLANTAWSTEAIAKMCALGTPVHDLVVPGGHGVPVSDIVFPGGNGVPGNVSGQWLRWIDDLFAGTPITSTCPR